VLAGIEFFIGRVGATAVCVDGKTERGGDSPTHILLCPKVEQQVPPVEMTRVGQAFTFAAVTKGWGEPQVIRQIESGTHLGSCVRERRTAGPSASSGFPVKLSGVDRPHAAFLAESRIRGR